MFFLYVSNLMKFSTRRWSTFVKNGFTIWEVLIIIVVISVGLLSVLVVLTNWMTYVQKTRQKVIALNLAREWMEAIYQIRDTNRTRRAWVKDQCRLKRDPLTDEWSSRCIDDEWIRTGSYVLQRFITGWQEYFALTWRTFTWIDFSNGVDSGDYQFSLCQESGFWYSCMGTESVTSEWKYFREIEWLWLFLKDESQTWWVQITCSSGAGPDLNCWTTRAQEFRFCSKVAYVGNGTWEVKLCWVLTNFKGK